MASTKAQRRRETRRKRSRATGQGRKWLLIGTGIAGAIALLVVLTFAFSGPETTGGEVAKSGSQSGLFDFPVELYQGEDVIGSPKVQFASLLGDKPVVLNYWASNCPPCSAEMPEFQRVWEEYSDRVLFFGLDVGRFAGFGGPEDSKKELRRLGVTYPAAPVPDGETIRALQVRVLPTTDFITPGGRVQRSWAGGLNESKLKELVEGLLDSS